MIALTSPLRSTPARLASPLLVLGALLMLVGCSESDSGIPPTGYNPDTDHGGDTGDTDTTPAGCDLPSGGRCVGANLQYCDGPVETTIACDTVFEGGVCAQAGLAAQCQVPTGGQCVVEDDGVTRYPRCIGSDSACVAEELNGPFTCVADIGSCDSSVIRKCLPGNQYYVQGCLNSQPRVYDCDAMGGRCAGNGCIELPEGADCETDVKTSLKYLVCGAGLICHNDSPLEEFGTCVPK